MPKRTFNQYLYLVDSLHLHNILLDTREIFIHGSMSVNEELEDAGVDHRMANTFVKNLRLLETLPGKDKPIIIHQHSIGGDWYAGMMIYDAIAQCKCPILFIMHGLAASMGSIIPQACANHGNAYRVIMPSAWFLVHDGSTDIYSGMTMKQASSCIETEKRQTNDMYKIYANACKDGSFFNNHKEDGVLEYIKDKLNNKEDWYLNAKDAVAYGFADGVMGSEGYESIEHIKKNWYEE